MDLMEIKLTREEKLITETLFKRYSKDGRIKYKQGVMPLGEFVVANYYIEVENVGAKCCFEASKHLKNAITAYVMLNGLTGIIEQDNKALTKYCKNAVVVKGLVLQIKKASCKFSYEDVMFVWEAEKELYMSKTILNV